MSSLADLKEQLADQIRDVFATVTDVDIQVEPRMVNDPTPPTIDIYPAPVATDPQTAGFGELDGAYLFTVRARVNTNDADANQDLLDAFYDNENDLCLQAAIEDDMTLAGWATQVIVVDGSKTGYQAYPQGETTLVGFEMTALVVNAPS